LEDLPRPRGLPIADPSIENGDVRGGGRFWRKAHAVSEPLALACGPPR